MFLKESHVGGQQSTSQSEKFYSDINVGPVGWDLSPARFVASKRPRDTLTALSHSCAPVAQRLEQQTHNLLVRGSNPCGGTNQEASCLTLTSSCCWAANCSTARWREDGAICLVLRSRFFLGNLTTLPSSVLVRVLTA